MNVLAGDIRDVALIAISLFVENNASFRFLALCTKAFGGEKYAELQRHVEARQRSTRVDLGSRNVMNAVTARCDNCANLVESIFGAIIRFKRTAWPKAGPDNDENDGSEKSLITLVERTVDEDVAVSACHQDRGNEPRLI